MDTSTPRRRRAASVRKAGWLAVAALASMALFATPGVALGHNAVASCGGFLTLDYPSKTATITRTDIAAVPYSAVSGGGVYAVVPGTYKVVWSDNFTLRNLVVVACPTSPSPSPSPSTDPSPTPTPPGELQITKTIPGETADFPGGQFGFSVDCQPGDNTYTTFITFGTGQSTGSVHFSVPAGLTCAVTETGTPDAGAGFTWLAPIIDPPVTIVSGQTVTVTVTDPRDPSASPSPSPSPSASPNCEELQNCSSPSPSSPPTSPPCTAANNCFFNSPSPSPSASPSPTPTPQSSVEAATATPTGDVHAATGKPHLTPPPTDALGTTTGQPAGDTWRIALLGLAALLACLLLFTPGTTSPERRRR